MINLFRPKTMRRMAVFAALVSPIVYLFGSLFTALAGAHGQMVFAQTDESSLVFDNTDFRFNYRWSDVYGTYVSSSNYACTFFECDESFSLVYHADNIGSGATMYLHQYDDNGAIVSNSSYSIALSDGATFAYPGTYKRFCLTLFKNDRTSAYFGDNIKVYLLYGDNAIGTSPFDYSDYVFGNFFAKDNFLVQWGRDAISEIPHGFAPFGAFWRYLDTNVLHLSNEQVGLMAYGYMYYAAHVLLFDVGFMLVTFFLSFIQKVGDKIGGEERSSIMFSLCVPR